MTAAVTGLILYYRLGRRMLGNSVQGQLLSSDILPFIRNPVLNTESFASKAPILLVLGGVQFQDPIPGEAELGVTEKRGEYYRGLYTRVPQVYDVGSVVKDLYCPQTRWEGEGGYGLALGSTSVYAPTPAPSGTEELEAINQTLPAPALVFLHNPNTAPSNHWPPSDLQFTDVSS